MTKSVDIEFKFESKTHNFLSLTNNKVPNVELPAMLEFISNNLTDDLDEYTEDWFPDPDLEKKYIIGVKMV